MQSRIAEIGFERGARIVARLLVHPQQIGVLLGKGGKIINEMRHVTGASICIFPKEQASKYGSQTEEVVQVISVPYYLLPLLSQNKFILLLLNKPTMLHVP